MREFSEQELVRREKLKKIEELGLDPFGHRFERDSYSTDIKDKYAEVDHDEF
jgi:lysyl-tRNA synthetase class 2